MEKLPREICRGTGLGSVHAVQSVICAARKCCATRWRIPYFHFALPHGAGALWRRALVGPHMRLRVRSWFRNPVRQGAKPTDQMSCERSVESLSAT